MPVQMSIESGLAAHFKQDDGPSLPTMQYLAAEIDKGWHSPFRNAPLSRRHFLVASLAATASPAWAQKPEAMTLPFRGASFVHRWSQADQHEFTPADDADLKTWRDMITLNVHAQTTRGEQLADVANKVLANYQQHGRILQTRSTPRSAQRPAEHLIVAVLGTPQLLEATFARCMLHEGTGLIAVVSHRIHGKAAGPEMSRWLAAQGAATEQALMDWGPLPSIGSLKRLPRSG